MTERDGEATEGTRGGEPLLRVQDLVVAYGPVTALRGVSVEVGRGEIVAVLGPNGAGKSTLLKTVAGVMHPSGTETQAARLYSWMSPPKTSRLLMPVSLNGNVEGGRSPRGVRRSSPRWGLASL